VSHDNTTAQPAVALNGGRGAEAGRLSWKGHPGVRALIAGALALAMLVAFTAAGNSLVAPSGASAVTAGSGSHSALADLAARTPDKRVEVIVQLRSGTDAAAAQRLVASAGGTVERELPIINGLSTTVRAEDAQKLSLNPAVTGVTLNARVDSEGVVDPDALATAYNQSVRSDRAWLDGYTGKGVGVAVIDTGIQGNLPDFQVSQTDTTSRVIATAVTNPAATTANDTFGHGTHVAGLIAGNGTDRPAGDPLYGKYAGVAPDANLIAVKASDDEGNASVLDVIDGLQFVVDMKSEYNIRVVNLSLKSMVAQSYKTDPLDAAVEAAWNSGIVVVAAAGNDGSASDAVSYAPANDPFVITVGGVDDMGTKGIGDDVLATWSSRGTTQDGFDKPDVLAPGAHMVSTIPAGSEYTRLCPSCVTDGQYFRVGGTSMAAAVVSGEAALLTQANPGWTPDQVKSVIVKRSRAVTSPTSSTDTLVDATGDPYSTTVETNTTVSGAEAAADKALNNPTSTATPNLALNTFLDPATGLIDYTRASWSRASWSGSVDALRASWSRASWSRASWSRASWSATPESCTDFERASWSRASWSRASWSRASWSRASWSADGMSTPDLSADDITQIDAEIAAAKAQCSSLLATIDPARASWSRASWSRASWSSSFAK
jgi:serine protease AprX